MSSCAYNQYYNSADGRCNDCNSTSATFDIQASECIHCRNLVQNADPYASSIAYKVCADPINTPFPP